MTVENNECNAPRCRTPLNAEAWCYAQVSMKKLLAVHNRCLMEKMRDFDSTIEQVDGQENGSTVGDSDAN